MDRIGFVNNLNCQAHMKDNFDELMSLYEVIHAHSVDDLSLSVNNNSLSIDVTLPSNEKANQLKGSLDRVELINYNNKYVVETTLNQKIINLRLNRVSG